MMTHIDLCLFIEQQYPTLVDKLILSDVMVQQIEKLDELYTTKSKRNCIPRRTYSEISSKIHTHLKQSKHFSFDINEDLYISRMLRKGAKENLLVVLKYLQDNPQAILY